MRRRPATPVPRQFLRIVAGESRKPFRERQRPAGPGEGDRVSGQSAHRRASSSIACGCITSANRWLPRPAISAPAAAPPTHPELLDWLAATFIEDGWSLKKLHSRIVLSRDVSASQLRPPRRSQDRSGQSLALAPHRRRLDLESMRDGCLLIAGRLDRATHGRRPVDIVDDPNNARRTVYGFVDRQSLPGLFRAFDFASARPVGRTPAA